VKRAVEKDEDAPVIIEVAEKAATGPFVRVMDEAKIGGARKLSVSTKKQ
jgi:biopolymer transport protein ExbD